MKTEAWLFGIVALFFAVTGAIYDTFAKEPAGKTALAVSFLMSALISAFFFVQLRRTGARAQDRTDAEIAEGAGPLAFFSPRSAYPPMTALGFALCGLGVVFGLWIFLVGLGILGGGVLGFVFQYNDRGT